MFKYLALGAIAAYAAYQTFFGDNRDDRPPSRPPSRESTQSPVRRRDERQYQQANDTSQRDYTPTPLETPASFRDKARPEGDLKNTGASLRDRARREGDLMTKSFQQSKEAYQRRNHVDAKTLSEEGERHQLKMEELDAKASAIIFEDNNRDKAAGNVDLHGLYVKEAIAYSEKAIREARQRGDSEVRLIVGQGTHSDGGVSRLRPTIQEAMQMRGVDVEVHPKNPGVLIVQWGSRW